MATRTKQKIKNLILETLENNKANETICLDVKKMTDLTDIMIITSGTSTRQVKALADHVIEEVKKNKFPILSVEGEKDSTWILIDLGDILVHIMTPETREFYSLEKLWGLDITKKTRTTKKSTQAVPKND